LSGEHSERSALARAAESGEHSERVYLHRTFSRSAGGGPMDGEHLRRVGRFTPVAGTFRWPRHTTLWELRHGWASGPHVAPPFAASGVDRLLIASSRTPSLDDQRVAVRQAECCYHEEVVLHPGTARRYLELVHTYREELAASFGWHLVGAFRTAMVHDTHAIVLWAVPTWDAWARWERAEANDPSVAIWRGQLDGLVTDWLATVLVAAESADSTATRRAQR
jgi:hypothetical protein